MRFSKKADLSLSINAIVILILAITMLGLGLAFMKGMFGKVTGQLGEMTQGLSEQQKTELLSSLDRITFQTSQFEVKRGTNQNMIYAIRDNLDISSANQTTLQHTFKLTSTDGSFGFSCTDAIDDTAKTNADFSKIKFQTLSERAIKAGTSEVLPAIINVPAGVTPTVYSCRLRLEDPSSPTSEYANKAFYITVTQ